MREETYREKGGERRPVGKRKGGVDGESDRETDKDRYAHRCFIVNRRNKRILS